MSKGPSFFRLMVDDLELPVALAIVVAALLVSDVVLQHWWIVGLENVAVRMILYVAFSATCLTVGSHFHRRRLCGLGAGLLAYAALMTPRRHVMMALASILPGWSRVWWLPFAFAVGIVGWLVLKRFVGREIGPALGWLALLCYLCFKMILSVGWLP